MNPVCLPAKATRHWALVAAGLLVACQTAPGDPAAPEVAADVTLDGVRLTHWEKGRVSAYATMASLAYHREKARTLADDLVVEPVDAQGKVESRLTALTADAQQSTGLVELGGAVRWTSEEDTATTTAATLDLRANEARGTKSVTLSGPGYTATGDGFTAELRGERRFTLQGHVKARFDTVAGGAP